MPRPSKVRSGWNAFGNPVPGDVHACLQEIGLEIIRITGEEAQARCPAHLARTGKEDRHPSFSVNLEEGVYGCFSCGFKGRFVSLVQWMLDIPEDDAIAWVRARGGIERAERMLAGEPARTTNDTSKQINEASLALYTDVPDWACRERGISPASCQRYGVLWDADTERWIVPIRQPKTNRLIGWQEKNARYFRNRPYAVKKGSTLFGINEAPKGVLILVESPLDVLRMHTAGHENVVSSFGAQVTNAQIRLIIDRADVLIVGLDNDRDGRKAAKAIRDVYRSQIRLRFLNYSGIDAKDPGDMTDEQIHAAVDTAIDSPLMEF